MAWALLQFVVSAAIIVLAGTALTRYADAIADVTGLGRVIVGSLMLAAATSLPELSVAISAVRNGWVDLALGDLLGAGLMNLAVLALLDLIGPARGKMLSRVAAAHALAATVAIMLLALAGIAIYLPPRLNFSIAGIGLGTWLVGIGYLLGSRMVFFNQRVAAARQQEQVQMPADARRTGLIKPLVGYLVAAVVIIAAAPVLARSADFLAARTGLGNTFFGTTLVALCTTLPELVAGLTAVRIGAYELAIGNIFGSIAFNLFLLVPVDLAYSGSLLAAASQTHVVTCLAVILISAIAVQGQLYQVEQRIHFLEPDAFLVLVLVLASLGLIFALR